MTRGRIDEPVNDYLLDDDPAKGRIGYDFYVTFNDDDYGPLAVWTGRIFCTPEDKTLLTERFEEEGYDVLTGVGDLDYIVDENMTVEAVAAHVLADIGVIRS